MVTSAGVMPTARVVTPSGVMPAPGVMASAVVAAPAGRRAGVTAAVMTAATRRGPVMAAPVVTASTRRRAMVTATVMTAAVMATPTRRRPVVAPAARTPPVRTVAAGDRVADADDVDAVAADVHRDVDGYLDVVAGADAGRVRGVSAGVRAPCAAVRAVSARAAVAPGVAVATTAATAPAAPALVGALVADRRVEDPDHVHGVAADVDRHVHRYLHGVAGQHAGRVLAGADGARVGVGDAARGRDHPGRRRHGHQAFSCDLSHCCIPPCLHS